VQAADTNADFGAKQRKAQTLTQWFLSRVPRSRFRGSTKVIWNLTNSVGLLYN